MRIREATVADTPRLIEMATAFLNESPYGLLFPGDPARLGLLVQLCVENGVIYVAEEDDAVTGMIALIAANDPFGGVRYADEIAWWVEPAHRAGITGPRLLMAAQRWTRMHRLAFLKMVAPANRPEVGAFYARVGFQPVETSYILRLC